MSCALAKPAPKRIIKMYRFARFSIDTNVLNFKYILKKIKVFIGLKQPFDETHVLPPNWGINTTEKGA